MNLKTQKRIAAKLLKVGQNRVWFDEDRLDEIKEAITKVDIRSLIRNKAIQAKPKIGISSYRSKKRIKQKRKGRQKGEGKKKGKSGARLRRKRYWINHVRNQRDLLKTLKDKKLISSKDYRMIYLKIKGGFFRSRRHLKLYLEENKLIKK
jgi:large subunit ribosomal protein L19e